jgi:glycosyltransferase involved in cell wall biosynthesis
MAKAFQDVGHEVTAVSVDERIGTGHIERKEQEGVQVYTVGLPEGDGDGKPLADMRPDEWRRGRFREILDGVRPDVVHVTASRGLLPLLESAANNGVPIVATLLDFGLICPNQFLLDHSGRYCGGQPSVKRCWKCVQDGQSLGRRLGNALCRLSAGRRALATALGGKRASGFDLKRALDEGVRYLEQVRSQVSHFIAPAPVARRIIEEHGVADDRVVDLVYSLPAYKLAPAGRPWGRPVVDRPLVIGYAGRVSAEKGIGILIDAFVSLPNSAHCELRILGRGANADNLRSLCSDKDTLNSQIGSGRISFHNNLDDDVFREEMARFDVAVFPSICYECTPLALIEVVAQGVPCIVSDSEGMNHVVSDTLNGRLFPVGDARALRRILEGILDRPEVLELWRRHVYKPYDDAEYARRLRGLYSQLATIESKSTGINSVQNSSVIQ